jgi:hypothetical protein
MQETQEQQNENLLQNWVFHFSPHTNLWSGFHRDNYLSYWNDYNSKHVIRSKDINVIVELIKKINGDVTMIDDFINNC